MKIFLLCMYYTILYMRVPHYTKIKSKRKFKIWNIKLYKISLPTVSYLSLSQFDTEICERTFAWLSRYARTTRWMNRDRFLFYILFVSTAISNWPICEEHVLVITVTSYNCTMSCNNSPSIKIMIDPDGQTNTCAVSYLAWVILKAIVNFTSKMCILDTQTVGSYTGGPRNILGSSEYPENPDVQ